MRMPVPLWILMVFLLSGCAEETALPPVVDRPSGFSLDFLVGVWINETGESSHRETWEKQGPDFYKGVGYVTDQSDTIFIEHLSIIKVNNRWIYSARVSDQNANQAVAFREVSFTETGIAFENREHDFPQRIAYERQGPNAMTASISGKSGEEDRSVVFPFERATMDAEGL